MINWIRAERPSTDSWITLKLPRPYGLGEDVEPWLQEHFPGWESVSASRENPDEDEF